MKWHILKIELLRSQFKKNIEENQKKFIPDVFMALCYNLRDLVLDLITVLLLSINILAVWRYPLLYRRYKAQNLKRNDLILNPIVAILDMPFLILFVLVLVIMPWRMYSYFKLSKENPHFLHDGKYID